MNYNRVSSSSGRNVNELMRHPVELHMQIRNRWIVTLMVVGAFGAEVNLMAEPTEAELMKEAKITKAQAAKTALTKVPQGTIKSAEIEKEHGKLIWSFDIAKAGTKNITEVQVDAKTGEIAAVEVETLKDQSREEAADKTKP
jgi:uncharacterized membrane protein YkoI